MLQFPLTRLPFRYELTTLAEGERAVAARLLQPLCRNDLVLMDQGFWSFSLFWQIDGQRAFFAIRKYPGVHFRTVQRLGPKDRLVQWTPSDPRQRRGLPESIRLRVVDYQIKGFRPTGIVTNVLDPKRIPRDAWIHLATKEEEGRLRLAQGLYHRRWEIETTFNELKVTQGMETRLRSRSPQGIAYEVAGHVLLYFLVWWLMVEAAETQGGDPLRISFKQTMEELLDILPILIVTPVQRVADRAAPAMVEAAETQGGDPLRISFKQTMEELLTSYRFSLSPRSSVLRACCSRVSCSESPPTASPFGPDARTRDPKTVESRTMDTAKSAAHTSYIHNVIEA